MKDLILLVYFIYLVGHPNIGTQLSRVPTISPVENPVVLAAAIREYGSDPMIQMVNEDRQKAGLNLLIQSNPLMLSASMKACDMVKNDYWAHFSPSGKSPWDFMAEAGYHGHYVGENICRIGNDKDCEIAFINSPSHKQNILGVHYTDVGIGRCGNFTVQHFGNQW